MPSYIIERKGRHRYVVESVPYYDKLKKKSRSRKNYIGKADPVTGGIVLKDSFLETAGREYIMIQGKRYDLPAFRGGSDAAAGATAAVTAASGTASGPAGGGWSGAAGPGAARIPEPGLFTVFATGEAAPGRGGSPLYLVPVSAGFPSPAEDYVQEQLDLHRLVVKNPPATFFLKVKGDSMEGAGIRDGDLLVVDRSRRAESGRIVVAAWEGELTVKRLKLKGGRVYLSPANPDYPEFDITDSEGTVVWGVVTYVLHKF